ncbi:U4/U6 small nuclear ribonucleoprotein Prp4 [Histoplasma capsulatum]|uniref:U4/U6 small nuclear ribonucleoprotein Prp4 n=1 Tax=Ajellomyces capsulatus TaxID=5037 RepID=A0A8A1MI25_AJECA|nr:U4/U6 small nuclear ribonucleoprotein Prp4 [Histoplasma capsulatum]
MLSRSTGTMTCLLLLRASPLRKLLLSCRNFPVAEELPQLPFPPKIVEFVPDYASLDIPSPSSAKMLQIDETAYVSY